MDLVQPGSPDNPSSLGRSWLPCIPILLFYPFLQSALTVSPLEIAWESMPLIHTSKQDATTIEAIGSYFIKQIVCCAHEILGPVLSF